MRPGEAFALAGTYRVQSKSKAKERSSRLAGVWAVVEPPHELDEPTVNRHLRVDHLWRGDSDVRLRPAFVRERWGEFGDEPDILYKETHFTPAVGSPPMAANIVDLPKAVTKWKAREPIMVGLLGPEVAIDLGRLLRHLPPIVSNEYFVHEAGHALGYATAQKSRDGYFHVAGRTAWPLVYVEEFRADLLGFGFAVDLLPEHDAAAVFLYNVFLRFGVHVQGLGGQRGDPYGTIPFMLYALLREIGWIRPAPPKAAPLQVASLAPGDVVDVMRACTARAREQLVAPEALAQTATDAAIVAARYYKAVSSDAALVNAFSTMGWAAVPSRDAGRG